MSSEDTKRTELMTKALVFSPYARAAADGVELVQDSVVKSMLPEDSIEVDGSFITADEAKYRRRQPREKSRSLRLDGVMRVLGVDSSKPNGVQIRLRRLTDGLEFAAFLNTDHFTAEDKAVAQQAEWDKRPLNVQCDATERVGQIISAEIRTIQSLSDEELERLAVANRPRPVAGNS